jgi:hypothetical protein
VDGTGSGDAQWLKVGCRAEFGRNNIEGVIVVSAVVEPQKLKGVTPSFPGDMSPEKVPEKYRLGRGFIPKGRYLDPEFQALELDKLFTRTWLMVCRE